MQGFRLNEITQLYINDIVVEDETWYFRINTNNKNQQIKNNASRRVVPIHPKLIELNFLDYIEKLSSLGEESVSSTLLYYW